MVVTLEETPSATSMNGDRPAVIPPNELPNDRFGIGRDRLNEALARLDSEDAKKVEAFWTYCAQRDLGRNEIGRLLVKRAAQPRRLKKGGKAVPGRPEDYYSPDSVYQLLTGKRMEDGANIAPMLRAIGQFLQKVQPSADLSGFMETRLYSEITDYCARAMEKHRIGYLVGRMSNGKTWAMKKIAEVNASWLYTQMPTGGVYSDYVRECAEKTRTMSTRQAVQKIRGKVLDALPEGVMVDDADLAFDSARQANGLKTFQYLKEAYDRKPRALMLSMDDWGFRQFLRGDNAHRLGRLWRRRIAPFYVPDEPYEEDLALYAASVGLDPAPKKKITIIAEWSDGDVDHEEELEDSPDRLQKAVCARDGIGVWLTMLRDAADLAREQGKEITWGAVLKIHAVDAAKEAMAGVLPDPN